MRRPLAFAAALAALVIGALLLVRWRDSGAAANAGEHAAPVQPVESATLRAPAHATEREAAVVAVDAVAGADAGDVAAQAGARALDTLLIDDAQLRERFERLTVVSLGSADRLPDGVGRAVAGTAVSRVALERAALESIAGGFAFERPAGLAGRVAFQLEPLGLSLLADVEADVAIELRVPLPTTAIVDVVDGAGAPIAIDAVWPSQVLRNDGAPLVGDVPPAAWPKAATSLAPGSPMAIPVVAGGRLALTISDARRKPPMREGFFDLELGLHHVWLLEGLRPLRVVLAPGVAANSWAVERIDGRRQPVETISYGAAPWMQPPGPRAGRPMAPAPSGPTLWIPDGDVAALVLNAGTGDERRIPLAHDATEVAMGP